MNKPFMVRQEFCLFLEIASTQINFFNYLWKCCVKENNHKHKLTTGI